jgi:uncharacterized protein YaaQ
MKLVIAVIQNQDTDTLFRSLAAEGLRATRVASSGGYLRNANATVFIGVEADRLERCLEIVRSTCHQRVHRMPSGAMAEMGDLDLESITPVQQGGGVLFVMPVERFVQFAPSLALEQSR